MPKTLPEKIIFTIIMAAIMVYGMIVYNVALATGGVTNATFGMALHEMPIMVPVAFVLEFFVVEKLATALAFTFMKPTDRPQFITYAISLMIVSIAFLLDVSRASGTLSKLLCSSSTAHFIMSSPSFSAGPMFTSR